MKDQFKTAMRQLGNAADNLSTMSTDYAAHPDERSRELLRRASKVVLRLKAALEGGRLFTVASAAQEFDHILSSEG